MDIRKHHDKDLIGEALNALKRLGVNARVERLAAKVNPDTGIVFQLEGKTVRYAAMTKRGLRPATLGVVVQQIQRLGEKAILITDYVTPQLADALRNHGIAFIDTTGNAYINNQPIFIWIKGERPMTHATLQPTGRAFQTGGLQVIFALLCNPELVDRPYREIARLADVAHGTVGWVMAELPKLGFVAEVNKKRRFLQPERLLQQWVEAYARMLRPKLLLVDIKRKH
jgi:hypothetical protein